LRIQISSRISLVYTDLRFETDIELRFVHHGSPPGRWRRTARERTTWSGGRRQSCRSYKL